MAEMGAIRMFMKMRAFDKIPLEGSISYRDLAASLGAEEPLVSTLVDFTFRRRMIDGYKLAWRG